LIPKLAEAMHYPWEAKLAEFNDILDGKVISEALEKKTIEKGDLILLQNRDGFCPLGIQWIV
jgi:hypothetical protein